jgi:hypothetical protein
MPNVAALDELVRVVEELRETNINKLAAFADRIEKALSELGTARPATSREVRESQLNLQEKMAELARSEQLARMGLTQRDVDDRKRLALDLFHRWNDITGFVAKGVSYEGELESIIEDAVEVGLYGRPITNADDWEEDTDPGGPNAIREADGRDGE